jgi:hypothetical protein
MHSYWHHYIVPTIILLTLQLGCSGGGYEQQIENLEGRTTIRIDLSNTRITDADLLAMEFPISLAEISLENTAITDAGVEALLDAKNLEQVNLGNTQITPACMEILEQLPNLQTVNVAGENIDRDTAFEFFKKIASKNQASPLGNKASIKYFSPQQSKTK